MQKLTTKNNTITNHNPTPAERKLAEHGFFLKEYTEDGDPVYIRNQGFELHIGHDLIVAEKIGPEKICAEDKIVFFSLAGKIILSSSYEETYLDYPELKAVYERAGEMGFG